MRCVPCAVSCLALLTISACAPISQDFADGSQSISQYRATSQTGGSSSNALTPIAQAEIRIEDDHVAGITRDTSYSTKAISAALPNYTVSNLQTAEEDKTEWVLGAFNASGFQVLQIFKGDNGKIRAVHGVTPDVVGPNGEQVGMTFSQIGTRRRDCRVGRNLWRGMAICKVADAPHITLVYAIPGYPGPFDELPSDKDLKQSAELQRIIWTPDPD